MSITTVTSAASSTTASALTGNNSLSADSFLTLLVTELRMQDPLDPMDTAGLVQQLAQMDLVAETRGVREGQELTQALTMVGRTVTWQDSATGDTCSGAATGVVRDGSTALLLVGAKRLKLSDIVAIS